MLSLRAIDLGKAYRLYQRPVDSLKEMLFRREYAETLWALRHVSFELAIGGSLGIIGDNGAGKSTLLRVLAGAVPPSEGRIERHGRTSAMLSLGAGFHPDLSGRENIQIGCAMLGLSPAETKALTPAIIDFSELGEFIERPVRTYSSGMQLRLGFSVATAVEPDILIVDEHLSVGDQHFRHKCMKRIQQLRERGCALVFCSHDLWAVGEVCERTLWLRDGAPAMLAATSHVTSEYQDHVRARDASTAGPTANAPARVQDEETFVRSVHLGGDCQDGLLTTGGRLEITIRIARSAAVRDEGLHVGVLVARNDGIWCHGVTTRMDGLAPLSGGPPGDCDVVFTVGDLPLLSGVYHVTVGLLDREGPHLHDTATAAATFTVRQVGPEVGLVRVAHEWRLPRHAPGAAT